jgi:RNA polymerase sigma-70 factor (ECF subfamily)
VQDTFLACVQSRDRFRREASFRSFVFATARNTLLYHFRKRRRGGEPIDPEQISVVDLAPGPSVIVAAKQEQRIVLEALRALPLDYQVALELYLWEGLTGPELAEVLGIGETAVRSRLHRAKAELRKQVERFAAQPNVLESTLAGLDDWAAGLRAVIHRR